MMAHQRITDPMILIPSYVHGSNFNLVGFKVETDLPSAIFTI
jgi:hypothetical protein